MRRIFTLLFAALFCAPAFAQVRKTKNIVVVTIDGYRWQEIFRGADSAKLFKKVMYGQDSAFKAAKYWAKIPAERRTKLMPFFWNTIAKQGQLYGNRDLGNFVNVTNPWWVSHAGYSEMFLGYVDSAITNGSPNNPHQTIYEFFNKQPGYEGKVAIFGSWKEYYTVINQERSGLPINAGWTDYEGKNLNETQKTLNLQQHLLPRILGNDERLDAVTYPLAKEYLKQNHPRVLYVALIETDAYGHRGQYDLYLDAANHADAIIADIWAQIQSDPFYKDQTTLFITADHGRGQNDDWISHYKTIPHSNEIWLAVLGPDVKPLGELKTSQQVYQKQFAQTISGLLGINFTAPYTVAEPIQSVLKK